MARETVATGVLILVVVALWSAWVFRRAALPDAYPAQSVERVEYRSDAGPCPGRDRVDLELYVLDGPASA